MKTYFFIVTSVIFSLSCTKNNNNDTPVQPGNDKYTVSTFAGSGAKGFADGTGTAAIFHLPAGIALDASGNVYIADAGNYRIRKITPAGVVTTVAGKATWGTVNGTGPSAGFTFPWGIVLDAAGNMYVTDDCTIRKITPAGVVTTVAGSSIDGYADGTGSSAKFGHDLRGIVLDATGNLYVADDENNRIRKINPNGVVTTLAGSGAKGFADGTGGSAQFNSPGGMAIDAAGNILVADRGAYLNMQNVLVRKITAAGVVTTLYKTGGSMGIVANNFIVPSGIALDVAGNIYLGDNANDIIIKATPAGVISRVAGSGIGFADGAAMDAKFNGINGLALDASGNIYVADFDNHRIRKITRQ